MTTQPTESIRAFEILASLGKEFKYHRTEKEILRVIAGKVYELTSAPYIYIVLKHRLNPSLELELIMEGGVIQSPSNLEHILRELDELKIQEVIDTQQVIFQENNNNFASWLYVPMSAVDRAIGTLILQHPTLNSAFSKEVGHILDAITDQAANAIDYYRLHERTKLIGKLESELTEISAKDEQDLIQKIYEKMQILEDIDVLTLSVVLQDKYKKTLEVVIADGDICDTADTNDQFQRLQKLGLDRIETIIESREPLLLCESDKDNVAAQRIEDMADTELARWVGVPMRIHGRAIGAFVIEHPQDFYVYNKNDAEFLDILSDQAANAIERVRLGQRSKALVDIERELLTLTQDNFTKDRILEIVARRAREVCDVYNLCIFLYDAVEDTLNLEFAYRKGQKVDLFNELQCQEILSFVPNKLLRQSLKEPVCLTSYNEVMQAFGSQNQERHPASWLGVPMRTSMGSIGVFAVYHMRYENIYDRDDARILDELSDQVALALDNVRLREIEQINFEQRIRDLELQGDIYKAVNQESLDDVLARILETAVSFTKTDYAEIWFCEFEREVLQLKMDYQSRRSHQFRENIYSIYEGLSSVAISSKEACYCANVKDDEDYTEITPDVRSELVIPLIFRDKIIGIMNLESRQLDAFSSEQQKLAKTLGDSAAVAIETSRLTQDLKTTKDQLELYLSLLEQLTVTGASFNEELLTLYIHDRASELMDTGNMYIALYNPNTDIVEFKLVYLRGEQISPYESRSLSEGQGKTEQIIRTHQSLRHSSAESEQWYKDEGKDYTKKDHDLPWLGVPILLGQDDKERCLGVIATYSTDKTYIYTEQEQAVLEKMGRWSAIALENAKTTKQVAEQQDVLTRSLIAQDLIHRLNSKVGTIPLWLQLLEDEIDRLEGVDIENAKRYIANSSNQLQDLINQIDRLDATEPEDRVNLRQILESLVEQLQILYQPDIDADRISIEVMLNEDLYDVVGFPSLISSSLDTVLKNGIDAILEKGSGSISIIAENLDGKNMVKITITDTGTGIPDAIKPDIFTPFFSTKKSGIGYGLWRAKAVFEKMGGHIQFESQINHYTQFVITLPQGK